MRFLSLLIFLLSLGLGACQPVKDDISDRSAALEERGRIAKYAAQVPDSHALQADWVQALRDARDVGTPEALAEALLNDVIPKIRIYYDALALMDASTEELQRIHAVMLATHSALIDSYSAFATGLTRVNYKDRRQILVKGVQAFHADQDRYRAALNAYYDEHGVELELTEPIRL